MSVIPNMLILKITKGALATISSTLPKTFSFLGALGQFSIFEKLASQAVPEIELLRLDLSESG
jgi:hypothetical protein